MYQERIAALKAHRAPKVKVITGSERSQEAKKKNDNDKSNIKSKKVAGANMPNTKRNKNAVPYEHLTASVSDNEESEDDDKIVSSGLMTGSKPKAVVLSSSAPLELFSNVCLGAATSSSSATSMIEDGGGISYAITGSSSSSVTKSSSNAASYKASIGAPGSKKQRMERLLQAAEQKRARLQALRDGARIASMRRESGGKNAHLTEEQRTEAELCRKKLQHELWNDALLSAAGGSETVVGRHYQQTTKPSSSGDSFHLIFR